LNKAYNQKKLVIFLQNVVNPNMEGSIDSVGSHQADNNRARHSSVTSISVSAATLTLAFALVNQVL